MLWKTSKSAPLCKSTCLRGQRVIAAAGPVSTRKEESASTSRTRVPSHENARRWCHVDVNNADVAFTAETMALFLTFVCPGPFHVRWSHASDSGLPHCASQALTRWRIFFADGTARVTHGCYTSQESSSGQLRNVIEPRATWWKVCFYFAALFRSV